MVCDVELAGLIKEEERGRVDKEYFVICHIFIIGPDVSSGLQLQTRNRDSYRTDHADIGDQSCNCFLNGDYDNELRAIIANENSNIRDILQQDNTYVNQKDDMILALAIKKYIYSEMSMDCDVTVSESYGVSGAASNKRGETGSKAGEIADSKTVGASGLMQVYITIKGRYAMSQGMEDNNEIIENQVVKLVCNGFGIDEECISVKLEIK